MDQPHIFLPDGLGFYDFNGRNLGILLYRLKKDI
jgi:hypothetical protein